MQKYEHMYSAYSVRGFACSGTSVTTSPLFHVSTPMLEKCFVHQSLQSLLVTKHSAGPSGEALGSAATPVCSVARDSDTHCVSSVVQNGLEKRQIMSPPLFPQGGLCHPAMGRAGRNGLQVDCAGEGRLVTEIAVRSVWCFPFAYPTRWGRLWLPGALADSSPERLLEWDMSFLVYQDLGQ